MATVRETATRGIRKCTSGISLDFLAKFLRLRRRKKYVFVQKWVLPPQTGVVRAALCIFSLIYCAPPPVWPLLGCSC